MESLKVSRWAQYLYFLCLKQCQTVYVYFVIYFEVL
jgi:hypothetical protein